MISKQLPLYDLAEWKNGLAFRKIDFSNKGKPVIKIAELKNGITGQTQFTNGNYGEAVSLTRGDMVFSWSGNPETSIDVFWYDLPDGWLNQHIFKANPKSYFSKEYVFEQLSAYVINFVKMAEARKTTMGHITTDHLEQSRIVLPPEAIIEKITLLLHPIHTKIGQLNQENRELIKLRDWLLPMLMNGQARVE